MTVMQKTVVAVLLLGLWPVVAAAEGEGRDIQALYNQKCAVCHASGAAGAPRAHNAADWAPRLEKGMDTLLASVRNGLNAMPPRGMCMDCTDTEYEALIRYMSTPAGE
jgi:cytochrome c5